MDLILQSKFIWTSVISVLFLDLMQHLLSLYYFFLNGTTGLYKLHKELCPRKPTRSEEKDEGRWSVRSETLEQRVRHSGSRMWSQTIQAQEAELVSRL